MSMLISNTIHPGMLLPGIAPPFKELQYSRGKNTEKAHIFHVNIIFLSGSLSNKLPPFKALEL
jgi:hypothetical protein